MGKQQTIEKGKMLIRSEGINFSLFKKRVSTLLTVEKKYPISEDSWVRFYNDYAYERATLKTPHCLTPEEWATTYFHTWSLEETGVALKIEDRWYKVSERTPPKSVGLLLHLCEEDDLVTTGMLDVDDKWVLLDEYRIVTGVTQWRLLHYLLPEEVLMKQLKKQS